MKIQLRDYQKQVLSELAHLPAIGLFMGTGTGKTITAVFKFIQNETPHLLVLCPSKVVSQWTDVLANEFGLDVVEFKKSATAVQINEQLKHLSGAKMVVVLSLESVARMPYVPSLVDDTWTVIVDESHKIKEYGTEKAPVKVTHAVLKIGAKTPFKIVLTATPTQKDYGGYVDYYTQLRFLGYMDMGYKTFESMYCVTTKIQPIGVPYPIKVIKGYKRTDELDALLKLCCRSYTPKLGAFEPQHFKITFQKTKSYTTFAKERAYKDLDLTNSSAMRIAKKSLTSGIIMGSTKFGERREYPDNTIKIEWVREFLSNTTEPVVIFYKYNIELKALLQVCKDLKLPVIVINGANKDKHKSIQDKNYRVVLGQFAACGESIDGLQYRSHICIYYAMPESSLEYRQALGRINRIGQEYVPMYYYLVMQGTIDEYIYDMTQQKVEFTEEVLNKVALEV